MDKSCWVQGIKVSVFYVNYPKKKKNEFIEGYFNNQMNTMVCFADTC